MMRHGNMTRYDIRLRGNLIVFMHCKRRVTRKCKKQEHVTLINWFNPHLHAKLVHNLNFELAINWDIRTLYLINHVVVSRDCSWKWRSLHTAQYHVRQGKTRKRFQSAENRLHQSKLHKNYQKFANTKCNETQTTTTKFYLTKWGWLYPRASLCSILHQIFH